jgi:hypothetical protein
MPTSLVRPRRFASVVDAFTKASGIVMNPPCARSTRSGGRFSLGISMSARTSNSSPSPSFEKFATWNTLAFFSGLSFVSVYESCASAASNELPGTVTRITALARSNMYESSSNSWNVPTFTTEFA